jgi:uncharacterized membrane protein
VDLILCGAAYYILVKAILRKQGPNGPLARAIGRETKERISLAAYVIAIPSAFVRPWIAGALYIFVALMWLIPDSRVTRSLAARENGAP